MYSAKTSDGLSASAAVMTPTATLIGTANSTATVTFSLIDNAGTTVATASQAANDPGCEPWGNRIYNRRPSHAPLCNAPPCNDVSYREGCACIYMTGHCPLAYQRVVALNLTDIQLWSVARPYMYTLQLAVSVDGAAVDSVVQNVGIRNLAWDAEQGLKVNEERVKMRGACNHESFTGVGAALPDRVDLLRVQQMRGVGMNAWRTSHNPPEPVLLDLTDRLGVLVLDENRVLATDLNCQGTGCMNVPAYAGDPAADMGALAKRDRNHPSVAWYSLCNEAGCGNGTLLEGDLIERAKEASYSNDGSRSVGANMGWISPVSPRTPMSDAL